MCRISNLSLAAFCIVALSLQAAGQTVAQDRILQAADDSDMVPLKGNVPAAAQARYDLGAAPASQPMGRVKLVLRRSVEQETALQNFLASVQQKGSPNYHQWLTPAQFGKLYGPSDGDIQKLTGWLEGHGFTVNEVAAGRTAIDFSGSVAQVQNAFHTSIHSYRANNIEFLANNSDPLIPSAFAAVVAGVAHLNTIPLRPMHERAFAAHFDPAVGHIVPLAPQNPLHPALTEQDQSGNNYLIAVPADVATIYDTPNSKYNANASGSATYDGTGVIIGIAGQSSIDPSLVANYRSLFIGDSQVPTIFNPDNVGDVGGDDTESYLDNEVAGSMAPGASIYFYTEPGALGGVLYAAELAIAANAVDILSVSYGGCESNQGNAGNEEIDQDWQQAAAQGITVLVSAGDTGSAGCDLTTDSQGNPITSASGGLAVNGLGSTPYNISVGGTDYDTLPTNFSKYVSTPSNGGSASTFYRTAKSYIPEYTWNDSPVTNATVSANVPLAASVQFASEANIAAGSGGKSSCAVQTGNGSGQGYLPPSACASGYAKPAWQQGVGVPNDGVRDLPDISLLSGDGVYAALWAVCDNSGDGGGGVLSCIPSNGSFENDAVGGTSAATPAFASIFALVRQKTGGRLGQAAATLYGLFNGSSSAAIFHDVTLGNNSVPCTPNGNNSASCLKNGAGYNFESGYDTNTGYDLATGLGSVDVTALVNGWTSTAVPATPTVTLTPSATDLAPNEALTVGITVTGPAGSGVPTGSVTLTAGTYTSSATALSDGTASITVPGGSLSPGTYLLQVIFTPDATSSGVFFAGSALTTVTAGGSFALSPTTAALTVAAGATTGNAAAVTLSTKNGYVGTVKFACVLTTPAAGSNSSYYPACTVPNVTIASGASSASVTASFATTARSTSTASMEGGPKKPANRWYSATGGAVLACVLFFGIPARRRSWRSMLGLLVFLTAMAGIGCGGGGSSNNPPVTIGTTAGQYVFTITGTDTVTTTTAAPVTITLTVN